MRANLIREVLGEHTAEILTEFGVSVEEMSKLEASGAIKTWKAE